MSEELKGEGALILGASSGFGEAAALEPALALAGTRWLTGNVIGVDGGEEIVG